MPLPSPRVLLGIVGTIVLLLPTPVEAQVVRRFRGGGIQVNAPYVRVNVSPYGGVSVRAPGVAVDPGGVQLRRHRRFAPAPPQQPTPRQPSPQQAVRPQPTAAAQAPAGNFGDLPNRDYVAFPTVEELATMDDQTLFTAVNDLGYSLDVRLSRLETGAGWQRYLQIPESALRNPAASFEPFAQALARYDMVSDSPKFAKIAGLPSFIATKSALRQVVARLARAQTVQPGTIESEGPVLPQSTVSPQSTEEVLPTPASPVQPEATRGEHSILKQASGN